MTLLENKVAMVTGAASGIGREIASKLAEAGARVVVSDIDSGGKSQAVRQIDSRGRQATSFKGDTSKPQANEALVTESIRQFVALQIGRR